MPYYCKIVTKIKLLKLFKKKRETKKDKDLKHFKNKKTSKGKASVAQSVERLSCKQEVKGSIPF